MSSSKFCHYIYYILYILFYLDICQIPINITTIIKLNYVFVVIINSVTRQVCKETSYTTRLLHTSCPHIRKKYMKDRIEMTCSQHDYPSAVLDLLTEISYSSFPVCWIGMYPYTAPKCCPPSGATISAG